MNTPVFKPTRLSLRSGFVGVRVLLLMACLAVSACTARDEEPTPEADPMHWLENPLNMSDTTHRWRSAEDWRTGTLEGLVIDDAGLLTLDPAEADERYPRRGTWTSAAITEPRGLVELLASWNLRSPPDTGLKAFVRVSRDESADASQDDGWSPWLYIGSWGQTTGMGKSVTTHDGAEVAIDYLTLTQPAKHFQVRLALESFDPEPTVTPAVRQLVAVAASERPGQAQEDDTFDDAESIPAIDLKVPYRSQQGNRPAVRSHTCSPTSLAMVLAYHGVDVTSQEVADRVYDREYALFGNWHRAVAYASTHGLNGHLTFIRSWRQAHALLQAGQPIIASIRFREGEFPSNPMTQTAGHLIVIRGMTEQGDAIVNDPAFHDGGEGIIYKKDELAHAWLAKGGITYLIYP